MKIIMTVHIAGDNFSYAPGDEAEFPQAAAIRLIESGQAVPARDSEREHAVETAPETTAEKTAAPRGKPQK